MDTGEVLAGEVLAGEVLAPASMPLERIEAEITELAGHLSAAECRWLLLIAEFDARGGHEEWGSRTCAHWLSWHCGLDLRSARKKLRVGHALADLPRIREAFAAGRLSYSKVRALTRIATPVNEAELVMLAEHATAAQVERSVRAYRGVLSAAAELVRANRRLLERYLRCDWDDDGMLVVNGRLPAELGAILLAALAAARELLWAMRDPDGSAEPTPNVGATNADALVLMAETLLAHGAGARKGGDRHLVVVKVDADVLAEDAEGGVCEVDGGPAIAPETARRLACDASMVWMLHDETGRPVNVSDKTRTIPPSLRRAVHARDQGCRFQGCGERRFVDVHHVRHRAHGGRNELGNLVELCWFHHRLVHEGGWQARFDADGVLVAVHPNGNVLPRVPAPPVRDGHGIERRNRERGITITRDTVVSKWQGEPLHVNDVVTALECIDRRGRAARN